MSPLFRPPCCYTNVSVSLVSSRPDPPEGAGDRRAEAEDSRGDGGDAQPVLLLGRQQPQPCHPALLLQVHGQ